MREEAAEEVRSVPDRPRDEEGQREPFDGRVAIIRKELRHLRPEPRRDGEVAQRGRDQLPVEHLPSQRTNGERGKCIFSPAASLSPRFTLKRAQTR